MVRVLEQLTHEERLKEMDLISLQKAKEKSNCSLQLLSPDNTGEDGARLFSVMWK